MSIVSYNGVELEFDIFDADVLEKYETVNKLVVEKVQDHSRYDGMSTADAFREQCSIIDDFFDTMFGDGTAQKLFEGKSNIMKHMEAFAMVADVAGEARIEMNNLKNKYAPNRAQKRFEQKNHSAGKKYHN